MIFVALDEAARKGELILVEGGMCRFHLRRDGVVVVREILVLPPHRRRGIGRKMLSAVMRIHPDAKVIVKCPAKYHDGNAFWYAMGFHQLDSKDGINLWERLPCA